MVEEMRTYSIPATYTLAQAEAFLLALYNAKVTYRGTQIAVGNFYGFNYDGAAWNNVHG